MAEPVKNDSETEFRKKNQWHSFASAAWGFLGMASFFGAVSTLASGLIGFMLKSGSAAAHAGNMAEAAGVLTSPGTLAVIGGLATLGLIATYMSQREATEVRILQDEHMAQQQAKCMPGKGHEQAQLVEYAQNQRGDGKTWQEVANRSQPQVSTRLQ